MRKVVLVMLFSFAAGILHAQPWNLITATRTGGTLNDEATAMVIDGVGNVYRTGYFSGTVDFDPGPVVTNLVSAGGKDIFITKSNRIGNLIWAKRIGSTGDDQAYAITLDNSGNIFTTGVYLNTVDFDPNSGTFDLTSTGAGDIFISKLNTAGNFVWAKSVGGVSGDAGRSIQIDPSDNVIVSGSFTATADFNPGAGVSNLSAIAFSDAFVLKLDNSGNFTWARRMGGDSFDSALGMAVDGSGNIAVTGVFDDHADFGATNFSSFGGSFDVFVVKLDGSGNFLWAREMGGVTGDWGSAIQFDGTDVIIAGYFMAGLPTPSDMDPGPGVFNLIAPPSSSVFFTNVFIVKLDGAGIFQWAEQMGGTGNDAPLSLIIDASHNIITTGYFSESGDFDPGSGVTNLTSAGNFDIFVSVLDQSGNFVWVEQMGGPLDDVANAVAIDVTSIYTAGYFQDTANFGPTCPFELTSAGGFDIFVQKVDLTAPPLPTIAGIAPTAGLIGSTVVINGNNFDPDFGNNFVTFGGVPADITTGDLTTLTVTVPFGANTGTVTVQRGCNIATGPVWTLTGSCVPVQERDALIALYNSTNGAGWVDNSNWFSTDESTWAGVLVSGCHISDLIMISNNLTGSLPPEIGDLGHLTNMNLPNNHISGSLPLRIGDLTNLVTMDLFDNDISGSIPSTIGNLTNLTTLKLDFNKLDGNIPSEIGNLAGLTSLGLGSNKLTGGIPLEIWSLSNLITLNLFDNFLDGSLPSEIGNLASIKFMKLGQNGFNGNIPSEIGNLSQLKTLWLDDNEFFGPIPPEIGNLTHLTELVLDNNTFNGEIIVEMGASPSLQILSLHHNLFTDMADLTGTAMNPTLVDISVYDNYLTFEDLEPNMSFSLLSYSPQAKIPPGGTIGLDVGDPLTIPFTTPGTSNSYQWYKDGNPIPGATSATYSDPSFALSDAGYYTVQIQSSIVSGLTLESFAYVVFGDPCLSAGPPTSGALDPSFDAHVVSGDFSAVGLQSTGKIIASTNFVTIGTDDLSGVLRFNSDGSWDNTFPTNSYGPLVLVQPDNKILTSYGGGTYAYVGRLNADGTEDGAFLANTPQYYSGSIQAIGLQPDGKIIIAATAYMTPATIVRLNADGTPDGTFSGPTVGEVSVIKVQPDGFILIGGDMDGGNIMRLDPSGATDASFETGGAIDFVTDILVQPDGKILVTGLFDSFDGQPYRGVVRLNNDGVRDVTFSTFGITDSDLQVNFVAKMALQPNGKIILAGGFSSLGGAERFNIARLNADGSVDCTFDPQGSTDDRFEDIALQTDGKIVGIGSFSTYQGVPRIGITRINNATTAIITITQQPADASVCVGNTATYKTNATGTTNITYQWQYSPNSPISFTDIVNGANYAGATTNTLSVINASASVVGRYRARINGDSAPEVITNDEGLFLNPLPTAPGTSPGAACAGNSITVTASGGVNGQYRWYTVPSGGTAIAGEVNATYVSTPATTTIYYVSINNGTCESLRTAVTATVNPVPAAPTTTPGVGCAPATFVAVNASGGTNGQYRWYTVATGGTPLVGQTSSTYIPVISTSTTYYVSIDNGVCESARTPVLAQIRSCIPVISAASTNTVAGGTAVFSISALVTTIVGGIDLNSIKVVQQPISGAVTRISSSGILEVDYSNTSFVGTDRLRFEACDIVAHCAQQDITIYVAGDITVYNALSPNGDNKNEVFYIQYIDLLPTTQKNRVLIFDRWGNLVFETDNYDNNARAFRGLSTSGNELPSGTYFYRLEFESEKREGFLSLKR